MCLSYEVDTGGIDKSHDKRERAREEGGGGDALTEPPAPELKKKARIHRYSKMVSNLEIHVL